MEQANKLMKEDLSFDPNSIEAGEVSQLDPNTKINVFQTTGRGTNGPKVIAKVTPEVGKPLAQSVQAAAREAQKQNSGAQVTGVVTAGDVAKTGSNLSNVQNAGSSADGIMEMRSKYLNENSETYAKKDFYNRRNGR